jgi:DNA-binding XRE family transcriptional regulator
MAESKIKEARLRAGLSRADMSKQFDIPARTLEDWESGRRKPPAYVEKLIVDKLVCQYDKEKYGNKSHIELEIASLQNWITDLSYELLSISEVTAANIITQTYDMLDDAVCAMYKEE